jgi:hypothetical protein
VAHRQSTRSLQIPSLSALRVARVANQWAFSRNLVTILRSASGSDLSPDERRRRAICLRQVSRSFANGSAKGSNRPFAAFLDRPSYGRIPAQSGNRRYGRMRQDRPFDSDAVFLRTALSKQRAPSCQTGGTKASSTRLL